MKSMIKVLALGLFLTTIAAFSQAAVIEVTQPVQLTGSDYYERGQSIVYDGTDYWMFYGRSTTETGWYQNGDPDVNDYDLYYKRSGSVPGLAAAAATQVTSSGDSYLGETGAAYFGGEIWTFTALVGGSTDLHGWYSPDGSSWTQVSSIATGLSSGSAHHDETAFGGEIFYLVRRGDDFYTSHSATPKTGGWSGEVAVGSAGGLAHFFQDGGNLYMAVLKSPAPRENQIFEYNPGTDTWSMIASTSSDGWDPTLFKVGSDYVFVQAPWNGDGGGRQYNIAWSGSTLATVFDNPSKYVTTGRWGGNTWVDMWPIGMTDHNGDSYLLYTSERDLPGQEGHGNIWYLKWDWNVGNDHTTWIQEAVNLAGTGDEIEVAEGTYTESISVADGLTITGESEAGVIVEAAATQTGAANVFSIDASGKTVTIQSMTIRHGDYGIRSTAGNVNVLHCTLYHNGWDGSNLPDPETASAGDFVVFYSTYATSGGALRLQNSGVSEVGHCTLYENDRGLRFEDGANGDIHDNVSHNNLQAGLYLAASSYTGATGCTDTDVYDNVSHGNGNNGLLSIGGLGNTFTGNNVYDNWNAGVMLWHVGENIIQGNTINHNNLYTFNAQGNNGDAEGGVYADGDAIAGGATFAFKLLGNDITNNGLGEQAQKIGLSLSSPLPSNGIEVSGNYFSGHDLDVLVSDEAATTTISDNSFAGPAGIDNVDASLLDASGNYWSDAGGPATGATVAGNVDYSPWLGGGTNDLPGFTGDFSTLYVDDNSPHAGAGSQIQEGIDLVTGSTVNVAAGSYPGSLTLPSNLNLMAPAGAASTTILGDTDLAISITGDNVTLDGFTVSNPNGHYALVATDRSGLTLRNNHFYDVGTGTTTGYVHCVTVICSNTDIDGFTIEDNEFSAIHADLNSSASALSFGWSTGTFDITNALIQRNHIHDVRSNTSDWPVGHGAYGILLNHSGNLDGETVAPQILDNTIEDLEGLWAHAIGLEGNTPGAVVTGNDISNLVDYKTPTDAVGVMVEDNAGWGDLNIHDNSFTALGYGVFTTMTDRTMVDATSNWWGSATGPYHPTLNPSGAGVLVGDNILFDPWTGLADLSILPGLSGPINCSQSSVLNFHYAPGDMTPALRGYEVTVACDAGLTFDGTDISDLGALSDIGMQSFYVTDNGDDSFTICAALLGPTSGLTLEDDLFSIEFHGTATGLQNVNILSYKLRDLDNGEFFATLHDAVIEVDCLGPDAPVLAAEPIYTQGTENTLDWSDESASGATLYYAECAEDAAFSVNLQDSGWIALLTHTFSGLSDNTEYFYRVKAKDALDNESAWSNVESSTQDDNLPVSEAGPLDAYQTSLTFDVPFVASDLTSGVAYVELYYQLNGGAWNPLGGTYTVSPISFTAGGDGSYCFFTVATDNVGNIELNPPSGDVCTIVDTTVPAGTFVINNDDVYTASTSVTLNNAITDDNGPLEMQFSNDNATWSGWVVYAPTYPWSLDLPDGTKTVYAQFKDDAGLVFSPTDDIILDTAPPGAADGLSGLAGHEKTILDWTDPGDGDLALIEVWRGPWHDGSNVSAYPEYDDLPGSTIPTRPANRTAADASVEWTLAGTALPGDEGFTDNFIPRGIYYYELFAQDMAGNYGPPLDENTQVMNYWLGDVRPSGYDGYVDVADITALGTSFGTVDGDGAYDNEIDVGPTDDWSRLGIPLTDNFVDFEDLMIFAMNYNIVAPRPVLDGALDYAMLTWYQVDEVTWALGLVKPCSNLKAIVLRDELPDGISVVLERSAILQHQGGVPIFLQNVARNGLDVSMAVMGTDAILQGEGELFRVNFSAPCELPEISLEVRGVGNLPLDFELEATEIPALPTVYAMARNFPNPFNPKTSIRFDLPEAQDVKLVVYDTMGRRIVTLLNESMQPGFHSVDWMGKDDRGNAVASGIYFYRIEAGPLSQTERMLLLK